MIELCFSNIFKIFINLALKKENLRNS